MAQVPGLRRSRLGSAVHQGCRKKPCLPMSRDGTEPRGIQYGPKQCRRKRQRGILRKGRPGRPPQAEGLPHNRCRQSQRPQVKAAVDIQHLPRE